MNKAEIKGVLKDILFYPANVFLYSHLKKVYIDNGKTVFITSASIGDLIYFLSLISAYQKQKFTEELIIIADIKKKPIIDAYHITDIKIQYCDSNKGIGKLYFHRLNTSHYFSKKGRKDKIYNTIPWVMYGFNTRKNTIMQLKEYLGLDLDARIAFPSPSKLNILSILDLPINSHRIVVINPYYGGETKCECLKEMEYVIKELKNNGYTVYCNIIAQQESLNGCIPLRCDLEELYEIANKIPLFISVRSGIVDWIVPTSSMKLILYPKSLPKQWIHLFSLSGWGINNFAEINLWEPEGDKNIKRFINDFNNFNGKDSEVYEL